MWRDIVSSLPADWFDAASLPILVCYVQSVSACEMMARMIASLDDLADADQFKRYGALMRLRDREVHSLAHLATKLRLTQQSRYGARAAETASRKTTGPRPWERV